MNESFLMELLYLRSAWRLRSGKQLPPVDVSPQEVRVDFPDRELAYLAASWEYWWSLALEWLARSHLRRHKILDLADDSSSDRMLEVLPPRWGEAMYGDHFSRVSFAEWDQSVRDDTREGFDDSPERRNAPDLIEAWNRDLRTIIVLPFSGWYRQQVGDYGLLLSRSSYRDPNEFSAALRSFSPR